MFRSQRLTKDVGYFEPFLQSVEEVDSECVSTTRSQLGVLPSCDNFDLKKLLDSGVELKKVPTRLVDSGAIPPELYNEDFQFQDKPDDKE